MPINPGDEAPDFTLPAVRKDGLLSASLSELRGRSNLLLYFYPKDDTPGCTLEACAFRDLTDDFLKSNTVVWGVSPDTAESHQKFTEKHHLPFALLADPDHAVAELYGAWKEKVNYGKRYFGIERMTFLIDREGKVVKVYPRVRVERHAQNALADAQKLLMSQEIDAEK